MFDKLVYDRLQVAQLVAVVGDRVYPRGALGHGDIPAKPETPFIQYGEGEALPMNAWRETRFAVMSPYDIYVYDDPGSYTRIKAILGLVNDTMLAMEGQSFTISTGNIGRVTECRFAGWSQDGYDVIMNLNSKVATYSTLTSRNP